jgi:hypothetical protein
METAPLPTVLNHAEQLENILRYIDEITGDVRTILGFGDGSKEKYLDIIRRAALVRQREALDATIQLCRTGHSAFAVCLLRPAYEELLWMEYFNAISSEAAELNALLIQKMIAESIEAQSEYMSKKDMAELGFTMRIVKRQAARLREIASDLRALGARLRWRQGAEKPTVVHIAQVVGRSKEYSFIYEATSRYVHFSPHELVRRVWGNPDKLTISSQHFVGYWSAFALHWGLRIYVQTIIASMKANKNHNDAPSKNYDGLLKLLESYVPQVPIITTEELEWSF